MDDLGIIDRFTETFSRFIDSGFGLLAADVAFLTSVLIAIDITLAGLFWAMRGEDNMAALLIKKVLYVGFFALIIDNFKSLSGIVFNSFATLGLKATGVAMTAQDLMRPGFVASAGFTASRPLLEKAGELIGVTAFFANFVTIVVLLLAWLIVLLAFFVLAVQLFIAIIEFKLTALAGFVLVPFALFGQTAFLAERVLGHIVTAGIKLMVLAIVVGIGTELFGTLIRPTPRSPSRRRPRPSWRRSPSSVWRSSFPHSPPVSLLVRRSSEPDRRPPLSPVLAAPPSPAVCSRLVAHASPQDAAGGAVKAAASLSGAAGAAYESGGVGGIVRATIGAPLSQAASRATAPVRDAYREGAAAGYRATASSGDGSGSASAPPTGSTPSAPPVWATNLARRQRLTQAGLMTSQALREGDRPATSAGPDLKDKS